MVMDFFSAKPGIGPTADDASERLALVDSMAVLGHCSGTVCTRPTADFVTAEEPHQPPLKWQQ